MENHNFLHLLVTFVLATLLASRIFHLFKPLEEKKLFTRVVQNIIIYMVFIFSVIVNPSVTGFNFGLVSLFFAGLGLLSILLIITGYLVPLLLQNKYLDKKIELLAIVVFFFAHLTFAFIGIVLVGNFNSDYLPIWLLDYQIKSYWSQVATITCAFISLIIIPGSALPVNDKSHFKVITNKADSKFRKHDYETAIKLSRLAIKKGDTSSRAYRILGCSLVDSGINIKEGEGFIAKAIIQDEEKGKLEKGSLEFYQSVEARKCGDLQKAIELNKLSLVKSPNHPEFSSHLAYMYLADSSTADEALQIANELIKLHPKNNLGYLLRGRIHSTNHQRKEAIDDLKKATILAPKEVDAYLDLASTYHRSLGESSEEAFFYSNKAIKMLGKKKDPYAFLVRGVANVDLENYEQAIKDLEQTLSSGDYEFPSLYHLTIAYTKISNFKVASNNYILLFNNTGSTSIKSRYELLSNLISTWYESRDKNCAVDFVDKLNNDYPDHVHRIVKDDLLSK